MAKAPNDLSGRFTPSEPAVGQDGHRAQPRSAIKVAQDASRAPLSDRETTNKVHATRVEQVVEPILPVSPDDFPLERIVRVLEAIDRKLGNIESLLKK